MERVRDRERLAQLESCVQRIELELAGIGQPLAAMHPGTASAGIRALAALSPREQEVLQEIRSGYRVSTIARKLYISPHTVRNHLKSIYAKLGVRSQADLMTKLKPIENVQLE